MRAILIVMGFWVRWIILNFLRLLGVVNLVHVTLQVLYRTNLVRKPLVTATLLHFILVLLLVALFFWCGKALVQGMN
jgi:hypothetical protein